MTGMLQVRKAWRPLGARERIRAAGGLSTLVLLCNVTDLALPARPVRGADAVISTLSIRSPIILSFKRREHTCEIYEVLLLFSELI